MSQCPAGLLCWELLHQVALCLGQIKPIDGLGEMQLPIGKPYTRPPLGRAPKGEPSPQREHTPRGLGSLPSPTPCQQRLLTNVCVTNRVGRLIVKRKGKEVSVSSGHQQRCQRLGRVQLLQSPAVQLGST
jgi:hypothetical protein